MTTHHETLTRHECPGEIAGCKVNVVVVGPEMQDLAEDDDRIGSDLLMERIRDKLTELQHEFEGFDE